MRGSQDSEAQNAVLPDVQPFARADMFAAQLHLNLYRPRSNLLQFVEFTQSTVLEWPAPSTAYVLSEQQVGGGGGAQRAAWHEGRLMGRGRLPGVCNLLTVGPGGAVGWVAELHEAVSRGAMRARVPPAP